MPRGAAVECAAVRRLIALTTTTTVIALLWLAPAALAHDGGEGLYGQTNDKVTTAAGFILIVFFPTFIFFASLVQGRLEKRKDARKAAAKARAKSSEWQRGW
jgi:ABC-type nickel/cobalt efflux system permease component RcnA